MEVRYVEWIDASGMSGWHDRDEIESLVPDRCFSVGFVIAESDEHVTLLQSYGAAQNGGRPQADHAVAIPKFAITKSRTLRRS